MESRALPYPIMASGFEEPRPIREGRLSAGFRTAAAHVRTRLVNDGQDTQITLGDGSTILLKGITRLDAVFSPKLA
jgi:hypothetical protein